MEIVGSSYVSLSGVFLALIGVYPSGTNPHTFVSTWFFLQIFIGYIIPGLGIHRRRIKYGLEMSQIVIAALLIAIIIEAIWGWPSAAVIEACGMYRLDQVVHIGPFSLFIPRHKSMVIILNFSPHKPQAYLGSTK